MVGGGGGVSSPLSGDEATVVLPPRQPPPGSSGSSGGRRRFVALAVLLCAAAGAVAYLVLQGDAREPSAGDAAARGDGRVGSVSSGEGGAVTVTVFGTDYVLAGPPGGVRGALLAGEVASWVYDFEAARFVAGGAPAAPFDPSTRQAAGDYEIAWVSPGAASIAGGAVEAAIREMAAASGVHVGVVCDGGLSAEETLACAQRVAASGADAVILGGVPGEVAAPALEVLEGAGLPVVTFDVWHPKRGPRRSQCL